MNILDKLVWYAALGSMWALTMSVLWTCWKVFKLKLKEDDVERKNRAEHRLVERECLLKVRSHLVECMENPTYSPGAEQLHGQLLSAKQTIDRTLGRKDVR